LSVYTRYLVEGIETGAADLDGDGWISVEELYNYTRNRVREAVPVMKPEIYTTREGYSIRFAKAPTSGPQLNYRREVDRLVRQKAITFVRPNFLDNARKLLQLPPRADVSISDLGRRTLEARRNNLNLSVEAATKIEHDVLQPYRKCEEKRYNYEQMLIKEIRRENPLSEHTRDNLKHFQQALGLRDQDVAPIEARILEKAAKRLPKLGITSHQNRPLLFFLGGVPIALLVIGLATYSLYSARINQRSLPSNISQKLDSNSSNINPSLPTHVDPKVEILEQKMLDEARSKVQTQDFEGAIEKYKQLITLNPKSNNGYSELGDTYLELVQTEAYSDSLGAQKIYQSAIESYDKAIQLKSQNALESSDYFLLNKRGLAHYYLQNYQKAIEDYDQAIQLKANLQPGDSGLLVNRGDAYHAVGKYQEAIKDYDQAIALNKNDCFVYDHRGNSYSELGVVKKALEDVNKAIECEPQYADAYISRGNLLRKKGYIKGAIKDYEKASDLYQEQNKMLNYDETQKMLAKLKRTAE
jgi:tetratricopeptide (TPR) repeat protein